jgi:tetratricopeptide (TPR) repeat protein
MKTTLILLVTGLLAFPLGTWAQDDEEKPLIPQEDFDELLMWMVDGKYEKVLFKAIRYTEDDKTSKEPLPYAFMSEAFFRISQSDDAELVEEYDGALKNALKYAAKFVKKDREREFYDSYTEFFNELRRATMNEAEVFVDDEKFTRAKSYYKYLYVLDQDDAGAWLMYGTVLWKTKAKRDAEESWAEAKRLLSEFQGRGLQEVQLDLLKYSIRYTAEMLADEGDTAAALEWLQIAEGIFPNDRELSAIKRSLGG